MLNELLIEAVELKSNHSGENIGSVEKLARGIGLETMRLIVTTTLTEMTSGNGVVLAILYNSLQMRLKSVSKRQCEVRAGYVR